MAAYGEEASANPTSIPSCGGAHVDLSELCKSAWQSVDRCDGILEGGLRRKVPLLNIRQTLGRLRDMQPEHVTRVFQAGGADGRSVALIFRDAVGVMAVLLAAVEARVAAEPDVGLESVLVALQRQEQKLIAVADVLGRLLAMEKLRALDEPAWSEAVVMWNPASFDRLLASGDLSRLWRSHFPNQLRAGIGLLLKAIGSVCGASTSEVESLRPWLLLGRGVQEVEVELADVAVVLDALGLARGLAFGAAWEELCGHAFITSLWAADERECRRVATVADVVSKRRESRSCALLPGWSREHLCEERSLLQTLLALGVTVVSDSEAGLVLQFEEAGIASLLVPQNARAPTPPPPQEGSAEGEGPSDGGFMDFEPPPPELTAFGRVLAVLAKPVDQPVDQETSVRPPLGFADPKRRHLPSARVAELLPQKYKIGCARSRKDVVLHAARRRLRELALSLQQVEVLREHQSATAEEMINRCNPELRSSVWSSHQRAHNELKVKEEQVALRKRQLDEMESATGHPDQIAHIRALLGEVADMERELEQTREWISKQESKWLEEEQSFQGDRQELEQSYRQRLAAVLFDIRRVLGRQWAARTELVRMDRVLLELEEACSSDRQRLHAADQELAVSIGEKASLLEDLDKQSEVMKQHARAAQVRLADKSKELEAMRRIAALQKAKLESQASVEAQQLKLQAAQSKKPGIAVLR